jgi:pimeloyl-ACP methyl ester carboxylesterase
MAERKFRTAVLVVHGMGSQRPLETVRGVINAVWFDNDDHTAGNKRLWSHPEPSGVDLDLTVMTTNDIPGAARVADFHELYWAHLLSETKAVAVLLWLFELARKGPRLRTAINGLWWCGTVFLCLLILSVSLAAVRTLTWFAGVADAPYGILIALFLMILLAIAAGWAKTNHLRWQMLPPLLGKALFYWIVAWILTVGLIWAATRGLNIFHENPYRHFAPVTLVQASVLATNMILVPSIALLATYLLMGKWGIRAFMWAYGLSVGFFAIYVAAVLSGCLPDTLGSMLRTGRVPWSLTSAWSVVAACLLIGVYLIINAAFLQPYLGDAARYFRNSPANVAVRREIRKNAVKTLDQLHRSRDYDRIVIVAHSLGTVVAYDMLRAYYSRICGRVPVDGVVQAKIVDAGAADVAKAREQGRDLIRTLVANSRMLEVTARQEGYKAASSDEVDAWLVTDFVTLGSPLTHAGYFMAIGKDAEELGRDFAARVREREFPTCPPQLLDGDGLITYTDHRTKLKRLHHGGMFALTRWTNLYFSMSEIFWGDAIGGPLQDDFGNWIQDIPVTTRAPAAPEIFTHTKYWDVKYPDNRTSPHIKALREAINLEDK